MVKIKEMPYQKKYETVLSYIKLEEVGSAFIEKKLGSQTAAEFQKECQKGIKSISENASDEEKYKTAMSNWIWMGGTKFKLIRSRLGEDGINQFIRAEVEAWGKNTPRAALLLLRLMRAISPGMAFAMSAKQTAYLLQFAGPVSVTGLSRDRMVMDVTHCLALDFPGGEECCILGCQRATPLLMLEQFRIEMKINRQGNGCSITLTPSK